MSLHAGANSGGGGGGEATDITIGTTTITGGTDTRVLFQDGASPTGVVQEDAGLTYDKTHAALTISGASVTTSNPVLNLSQTWSASAVTFTGFKFNANNSGSAAASLLADFQLSGSSIFSFRKDGTISSNGGNLFVQGLQINGNAALTVTADGQYGLANNAGSNRSFLSITSNAVLQFGQIDAAAPVAQTTQVQNVVAGTSNTNGANWTINGSKSTGTGTGGSIIFQTAAAGATGTAQNALGAVLTLTSAKVATLGGPVGLASYRVADLPAATTTGQLTFINDSNTASGAGIGTTVTGTGGGSNQCPAFSNGANWVLL